MLILLPPPVGFGLWQKLVALDKHGTLLRGQPLRKRPLWTHLRQVRLKFYKQ